MITDIVFDPIFHNKAERIAIHCNYNAAINKIIKTIPGARWSQTNNCWHIPLNEAVYKTAVKLLQPQAPIDIKKLSAYLHKRKKIQDSQVKEKPAALTKKQATVYGKISTHNLAQLAYMIDTLTLKAYSEKTKTTYRNELMQLLRVIGSKKAETLTADELRRYMLYAIEKEGINEFTANSRLNALKFYYEKVLGREKMFIEIPRPKKPMNLPKVLGERELSRLFTALQNKKHKAILFTAYSAGLRVSEVVNLKIEHIDSDRMQIFIDNAKGKKDRYVMLSPVLLDILRSYMAEIKPKPLMYLFEGGQPGNPYHSRTAQKIFQMAKEKAGIKKDISFHALRHSFATHLLEKGIDIKYIKDLLGHFSIITTTRYLHVKKEQLVNIVSPLDDLWEKGLKDV